MNQLPAGIEKLGSQQLEGKEMKSIFGLSSSNAMEAEIGNIIELGCSKHNHEPRFLSLIWNQQPCRRCSLSAMFTSTSIAL